jgi:CRP/FNR family cyclic AMP-dependent transcriptional regulator
MRSRRADLHVVLLRSMPTLSGRRDRELAGIAPLVDVVHVDAGRVLMRQGTSGREAFMVVEGEAEVRRDGETIATLGPGELLGELALLDQLPRTATVTAMTPMSLLVVSKQNFGPFVETPGVGEGVAKTLAARFRRTQERLPV